VEVKSEMEFRIKKHIFCELVDALRAIRDPRSKYFVSINNRSTIPDDYGVQMQINITVDEIGALNPSVGYQEILPNAIRHVITKPIATMVTVPQSFSLNAAGTVSSDAARTDTVYSYYNVGKISAQGANPWCRDPQLHNTEGSSPLLKSDLGIASYLNAAVKGADLLASSAQVSGGAGKTAKYDVYSYDVKFGVVTSGGVNPVWKLVNLNAGNGNLPLVNAGRTRTHELILTFGPGTDKPFDFAQQTHFVGQIVQANQRRAQPGALLSQ